MNSYSTSWWSLLLINRPREVLYLVSALRVYVNCCRFECGAYQPSGSDILSSRPILPPVQPVTGSSSSSRESLCLRSVMHWLERVLTALDCYSWTFGQNLINPSQVFAGLLMPHDMVTWKFNNNSNNIYYLMNQVNSQNDLSHDDSTINIVPCISIISVVVVVVNCFCMYVYATWVFCCLGGSRGTRQSVLISTLEYFVKLSTQFNVDSLMMHISASSVVSPREREQFNRFVSNFLL